MPKSSPASFIVDDAEMNESIFMYDISRLMKKHFDRRARALGLTRAQWLAVGMLRRNPGINQVELADKLDVEPMTVARLIDRLEEAGWVERRTDKADRRAKRLYLTSRTQTMVNQIRNLSMQLRSDALAGITPEEHTALLKVLQKIRNNLVPKAAS